MVFDNQRFRGLKRAAGQDDSSDSEEDNFEEGSNQIEMQSQMEAVDGERFERLVS
jgi:hypothetical protein